MTEPGVALTDYLLTVQCALFAYLILRGDGRGEARVWFMLLFGGLALASLAGGTVHGFFLDEASWGNRVLWTVTMTAIGVVALSMWGLGASIELHEKARKIVITAAAMGFVAYLAVILMVSRNFIAAVVAYLPGVLFLLFILTRRYLARRERPVAIGVAALLLTLVASYVQVAGIAVHPVYFNHNALYHLIELVALALLYVSARHILQREPAE